MKIIHLSDTHVDPKILHKINSQQRFKQALNHIKDKILWGLRRIKNEIDKKKFKFDISKEDIHMNIEGRLFELIGIDSANEVKKSTSILLCLIFL